MIQTPDTWALVRAAYCDGDELVAEICARFGITRSVFYKRAKAESWPQRTAKPDYLHPFKREGSVTRRKQAKARSSKAGSSGARSALALRLYKALDLKLTQLEELMAHRTETSTMDQGRQTRAIAQLIKAFERVTEYDPELLKSASLAGLAPGAAPLHPATDTAGGSPAPAASSASADTAGTEQLRRDIASRIERIVAKRHAGEGAG